MSKLSTKYALLCGQVVPVFLCANDPVNYKFTNEEQHVCTRNNFANSKSHGNKGGYFIKL